MTEMKTIILTSLVVFGIGCKSIPAEAGGPKGPVVIDGGDLRIAAEIPQEGTMYRFRDLNLTTCYIWQVYGSGTATMQCQKY